MKTVRNDSFENFWADVNNAIKIHVQRSGFNRPQKDRTTINRILALRLRAQVTHHPFRSKISNNPIHATICTLIFQDCTLR